MPSWQTVLNFSINSLVKLGISPLESSSLYGSGLKLIKRRIQQDLGDRSEASQLLSEGHHQMEKQQTQRCPVDLSLSLFSAPHPARPPNCRSPSSTVIRGSLPDSVAVAFRQQLPMDNSGRSLFMALLQWLDVPELSDSLESSNLSTCISGLGRLASNFISHHLTLLLRLSLLHCVGSTS